MRNYHQVDGGIAFWGQKYLGIVALVNIIIFYSATIRFSMSSIRMLMGITSFKDPIYKVGHACYAMLHSEPIYIQVFLTF